MTPSKNANFRLIIYLWESPMEIPVPAWIRPTILWTVVYRNWSALLLHKCTSIISIRVTLFLQENVSLRWKWKLLFPKWYWTTTSNLVGKLKFHSSSEMAVPCYNLLVELGLTCREEKVKHLIDEGAWLYNDSRCSTDKTPLFKRVTI